MNFKFFIRFISAFHQWDLDGLWGLTPLSTIFQLYRGGPSMGRNYYFAKVFQENSIIC
jgi:hypothetical protein